MSKFKFLASSTVHLSLILGISVPFYIKAEGLSRNGGSYGIKPPADFGYKSPNFDSGGSGAVAQPGPADGFASSQSAVDSQRDASHEGHDKELEGVKALVPGVKAVVSTVTPAMIVPGLPGLNETLGAFAYYSNLHGSCVKTQSTASTLCREQTSPHLQKSLNDMNTVMGMIGGVAVKDACSNMAKIMRLGQAGLTAYTAACSAARAACEGACSTVNTNLKRIENALLKTPPELMASCTPSTELGPPDPSAIEACTKYTADVTLFVSKLAALVKLDADPVNSKSIALKNKACTYQYANMLVSAGVGIASVMNSLKQSKGCEEQTDGTGVVATEEQKSKCADPKNAALPECICMANPRTPGCSNGYTKPGETSSASLIAGNKATGGGSTVGKGPGSSTLGSSGAADDPTGAFAGDPDSGSGGAMASGSGGSSLGGGGGGSGKDAGEAAEGKKGLNANILGAAGGGGGGGGGGSWSSVRGSGAASPYRAYLPGGAKDPARGLAGQQSWAREVTGQGGKSNWEKVRDRYRDNKNSLLSN